MASECGRTAIGGVSFGDDTGVLGLALFGAAVAQKIVSPPALAIGQDHTRLHAATNDLVAVGMDARRMVGLSGNYLAERFRAFPVLGPQCQTMTGTPNSLSAFDLC
jgi:hypothetical protein